MEEYSTVMWDCQGLREVQTPQASSADRWGGPLAGQVSLVSWARQAGSPPAGSDQPGGWSPSAPSPAGAEASPPLGAAPRVGRCAMLWRCVAAWLLVLGLLAWGEADPLRAQALWLGLLVVVLGEAA